MTDTDFDIVIRGGTIVDGTGGEPYAGDVAILNGVIARVGNVSGRGREEIEATGALPGRLVRGARHAACA